MVRSKACPRCRGDLARVRDVGESYFSCVQCGYVTYQQPEHLRDGRHVGGPTSLAGSLPPN